MDTALERRGSTSDGFGSEGKLPLLQALERAIFLFGMLRAWMPPLENSVPVSSTYVALVSTIGRRVHLTEMEIQILRLIMPDSRR